MELEVELDEEEEEEDGDFVAVVDTGVTDTAMVVDKDIASVLNDEAWVVVVVVVVTRLDVDV